MNVTLKPFDFAQAVARAGLTPTGQPLQRGNAVEGTGFQQVLGKALGAVSKAQTDATAMQREVQLDNPTVSLEQTMVAMQKAQIGFQATLQVRNRLVQAYSDIMNMQVRATYKLTARALAMLRGQIAIAIPLFSVCVRSMCSAIPDSCGNGRESSSAIPPMSRLVRTIQHNVLLPAVELRREVTRWQTSLRSLPRNRVAPWHLR